MGNACHGWSRQIGWSEDKARDIWGLAGFFKYRKPALFVRSFTSFESYLLLFSPTEGLLKLSAVGLNVSTGDSGSELVQVLCSLLGRKASW
jgi:hypothetical protein